MATTNVLLAGLAFLGLIMTVWFQRKQIEVTSKQAEAAIKAMEDQTLYVAEQADHMDETLDFLRLQSAPPWPPHKSARSRF